MTPALPDPTDGTPVERVCVLGGFQWRRGATSIPVTAAGQRLIAFLTLRRGPFTRPSLAGTLWPDSTDSHAAASLRTELWKLRQRGSPVSQTSDGQLALGPSVISDVEEAVATAHRVLSGAPVSPTVEESRNLRAEILPHWQDEWVHMEREQFHQLRLHALEALCDRQTLEGRFAAAVETGLAAVDADPFRESSRRVLIAAYLGEGNVHEAICQYRLFDRLLAEELDAEPTAAMRALIARAIPHEADMRVR